jgi:hypothetical protein
MIRFLRKLLRDIRAPRGPSRRGGRRVEIEVLEDRCLPTALGLVALNPQPLPPQVALNPQPLPPRAAIFAPFLPSDPCVLSPTLPLPPPRVF